MLDTRISDLLEIQHRFLRSTHLNRDFKDPDALKGYILTKQAQSILERIAIGLAPNSGQRASRITGDYGSGKSSLALVLAHLFSEKRSNLPDTLKDTIDYGKVEVASPRMLPVLVTGTRSALSKALLKSLYAALLDVYDRGREPNVLKHIREVLFTDLEADIADATLIGLLQEAIECLVNTDRATGILIILDELGKFLEFAAQHPERQDIYLLQQLAEMAARSGKHPLFVIGLLHQGFHAYADQLSQSMQREWEKVSGRFEEILFHQSIDQIVDLTVNALHIRQDLLSDELVHKMVQDMEAAHHLGWYGFATSPAYLYEKVTGMYPLHPTVLPVLIKIFTRFGQNERSLFSFLLSPEPFGLQDFAEQTINGNRFYRLHNLYDYTRATFGHRISLQSYRSHWPLIESIISNFTSDDEHDLQMLKTIALLNLVDDTHLLASREAIALAVDLAPMDELRPVDDVLQELHTKKHIIHYRGASGGYCLWPYTSVNLEQAYKDASRAIGSQVHVSQFILQYLEKRPLVARRHYITTGTLRYFDVLYMPVVQLSEIFTMNNGSAVGRIIIPLCETQEERQIALRFIQSPKLANYPDTLIAISQPLADLTGLLQEVQRWQWISENVPELVNDTYAAEEVNRQTTASRQILENRIHTCLGVQQSVDHMEAVWFYKTEEICIPDRRSLLSTLSNICDDLYDHAPRILNELVNRDALSSAAAAARLRLIELILTSSSEPMLGLDPASKPPEMSIYLSLCKKTGLHQEATQGWAFIEPVEQDICNVCPIFQYIQQILEDQKGNRISVATVFNEMRKPPYGVRDGLTPIFLAIFTVMHKQDLAFYENGSFLREIVGHDFRRLIKTPSSFEIQFYKVSGLRIELFDTIHMMLEWPVQENRPATLLDVVRPLFVLAARLPEYTRRTRNLSVKTLAVRSTLISAREPAPFLFRDLPQACGFAPFKSDSGDSVDATNFIQVLKDTLDELNLAYPNLLTRIKQSLLKAFDLNDQQDQFRDLLADRSKVIAVKISEPRLKAFCLRLIDVNLSEDEWLEALGSFICSKIPASWADTDEHRFGIELNQLCTWFHRVEATLFSEDQREYIGSAIRVAVTKPDGGEIDQVLYVTTDEEKEVRVIQEEIIKILGYNKRISLVAASRVLWELLSQEKGDGV